MRSRWIENRGLFSLLAAACCAIAGCQLDAPDPFTGPLSEFTGFEEPERRTDRPPIPEPPDVPPGLSAASPLTLRVVRRTTFAGGETAETVQNISRTERRIHLAAGDGEQEWLFLRSEADPRRVTGTLIDHRQRLILDYEESDLRSGGIASSWLDAAGLGLPPGVLQSMERSDRRERIGDFETRLFVAPSNITADMPAEVWWSETDQLPVRVVRRSSAAETQLETFLVGREVDERLFEDPQRRFPSYTRSDLADWRERH